MLNQIMKWICFASVHHGHRVALSDIGSVGLFIHGRRMPWPVWPTVRFRPNSPAQCDEMLIGQGAASSDFGSITNSLCDYGQVTFAALNFSICKWINYTPLRHIVTKNK